MRILLVGANGTIGKAVAAELGQRHEILAAGRSQPHRIDIGDPASIDRLFNTIGQLDAIICTAGSVHFGPLAEMTPELFNIGLTNKLMGQVNLALKGQRALTDGGSITLITGLLSENPIRFGASASLVNGALEAFVRAAAIELPRGLRINAVSPTIIEESVPFYGAYFRGFKPVPARDAALAFSRSAEGAQTGQVYKVT